MCAVSQVAWDFDSFRFFAERSVEAAREVGALFFLPVALNRLAMAELWAGNLRAAEALVAEAQAITDAIDSKIQPYAPAALGCARGREVEARAALAHALEGAQATLGGVFVRLAQAAGAQLCNGLGQYQEALGFAQQVTGGPFFFGIYLALPELIEAATRCGQHEVAIESLERLTESTAASGSDWALGIEARSQALVSSSKVAESLYQEAIDRLSRSPLRPDAARAQLLYGEWLRREGRRVDARAHLRIAFEELTAMGIEAFAERARVELAATGQKVRKRTVDTRFALTAQEMQIALLVASGHTNPEIGAQLFLSPRTVEWHLRTIFSKLDVKSRRQLRGLMPQVEQLSETAGR